MITTMETMTRQQKRDIRLVARFVQIYCAGHHGTTGRSGFPLPAVCGEARTCPECATLLEYAVSKRLACPREGEKPSCRRCRIHCYAPPERKRIREVMAYSGKRMIMTGRLDYLWHYLF